MIPDPRTSSDQRINIILVELLPPPKRFSNWNCTVSLGVAS